MSVAKTIAAVSGYCRSDLSKHLTKTVVTDGFLLQPGSDIIRLMMDLCTKFSVLLVVEGSRLIARLVTWKLDLFD
jgi:hypothetical protein